MQRQDDRLVGLHQTAVESIWDSLQPKYLVMQSLRICKQSIDMIV